MLEEQLLTVPRILPSTLRLIRVRERLLSIVLSAKPVYIGSHWKNGRNVPCTRSLLNECPWCVSTPLRHHAYLGVRVTPPAATRFDAVVELSPQALLEATQVAATQNLHGLTLVCSRRHKKAPIDIHLDVDQHAALAILRIISTDDVLRTIAKVYGLPDPASYDGDQAWLLALRSRVFDPTYSPSRAQPPTD
jgi:hypothetical protein